MPSPARPSPWTGAPCRRARPGGAGSGARSAGRRRPPRCESVPFCWRTVPSANSTAARMASASPMAARLARYLFGVGGRDVTCSMRGKDLLSRRAASNLAAAKMDLAGATDEGDEDRITLLQTLCPAGATSSSTGPSCSTTPSSSATSRRPQHVAVVVPGVGDGTNLCDDWIPDAMNLYEASTVDRRRPVEGLRQPGRRPGRGGGIDRVQRGPGDGRPRPDRVRRLARPWSPSSR